MLQVVKAQSLAHELRDTVTKLSNKLSLAANKHRWETGTKSLERHQHKQDGTSSEPQLPNFMT